MNPLFESFQKQSCGSGQSFNLQQAMLNMAEQVKKLGVTPEQLVRQKIQNGEMTQAQFEQYAQLANRILGR